MSACCTGIPVDHAVLVLAIKVVLPHEGLRIGRRFVVSALLDDIPMSRTLAACLVLAGSPDLQLVVPVVFPYLSSL